jgi:glycosyltransferase involved in cell wall biosynthesis
LIEAQLAGLPVVATDAGSNSEVIENNKTGIISTKNIIDLSSALKSIFADPTRFSAMGAAAKQRGIKEFGLDQMLEKHIKAYDTLTSTDISLN